MITIKSQSELDKMEIAGRIVEDTLNLMARTAKAGMRTDELNSIAEDFIRSQGAVPSFLNYAGYPKSICTSVNEQVVHGIPGSYRLRDGDILSVDIGAVINGFHGDAARTLLIGEVDPDVQELVKVTRECFFEGLRQVRPGNRISDIGKAVQAYAESQTSGCAQFLGSKDGAGHPPRSRNVHCNRTND